MLALALALVAAAAPAPNDATLEKLRAALPRGWTLSVGEAEVGAQRAGEVVVLFENRINAPLSRETEAGREARIRAHGKASPCRLVWRREPRWTAERRAAVTAANEAIAAQLSGLERKHGVDGLRDRSLSRKGGDFFRARTEEERRRVADYQREKSALEARIQPLPDCDTERASLFLASRSGVEDEHTVVAPAHASEEAARVERALRELCERR